jgi:hypothetical protein
MRPLSVALVALLLAACGSTGATPDRSAVTPDRSSARSCNWLTKTEVEQAIGRPVSPGEYDPTSHLCSYQFVSKSGINTDLVAARDAGPITNASRVKGRTGVAVSGLGDDAVFYRANTIDDGNNVLIADKGDRSVFLGGEFLTLAAARQLAEIVLGESST